MPSLDELRTYLDHLVEQLENIDFIADDPISIPHSFDDPEDQEIIGLYAALLAWGQRQTLLNNLANLCERMSYTPRKFVHDFQLSKGEKSFAGFVHRTFQPIDAIWLTNNLSIVLKEHNSLESAFLSGWSPNQNKLGHGIQKFSNLLYFADSSTPSRLRKHLARPNSGSACKRFCMYLRWMARPGPVDLGIWPNIPKKSLILPLDVHSGRQARLLGMLTRKSNDWKAALELTENCKKLSADDPCKYDFAFFGVGAKKIELAPQFIRTESIE